MGTDAWLESEYTKDFIKAVGDRVLKPGWETNFAKALGAYYTELQATGCYFRDADNPSSLLAQLGISMDEIHALLDEGKMPVAAAKTFRVMIESRASTMLTVDAVRASERFTDDGGTWINVNPPERWARYFGDKKDRLVALLDRSIAKDEPLRWSLGAGIDAVWLHAELERDYG